MKKFIALFTVAFAAFIFEGCAPRTYTIYEEYEEPEEEPKPKPKPKPAPKPAPKVQTAAKPAPKKTPEIEIVTDNLYPIPKALDVDNDFTISSLTPVSFNTSDHCNEVYFFTAIVTPTSGYHGLVDISMSEVKEDGKYSCKYFGTAVVYQVKPNPFIKETIKYEDVVRKLEPSNN